MATQLKNFSKTNRRGPRIKYPFDEWFNGKWWRLHQKDDFKCDVSSMADLIRYHAKRREVIVEIETEDKSVVFRSLPLPKKGKKP